MIPTCENYGLGLRLGGKGGLGTSQSIPGKQSSAVRSPAITRTEPQVLLSLVEQWLQTVPGARRCPRRYENRNCLSCWAETEYTLWVGLRKETVKHWKHGDYSNDW
jgi:hypothetical protein